MFLKFSHLHALYYTQAIRLLANVGFLALIYFNYSETELANYFLGVALIQLLFLVFGFFSTPYFVTRYVISAAMARRFAPRQFILNVASWCVVLALTIIFAPQHLWLVIFFSPMVFARVCDDLTKSSNGFAIFLTVNLISASVNSVLKILSALLVVDVVWLFAFVFFEDVLRAVLYMAMPQFRYVLHRPRFDLKELRYYRRTVMRTFSHGLSSFLTGMSFRMLFLTMGSYAPASSVAIAGYFSRVFDIGNVLIVQFATYRFNKDRPTSKNLEEIMAPIYRFSSYVLGVAVVFLFLGALLHAALPMPYKEPTIFFAVPACVAISMLNINRVIIFNILKQPIKLLYSSAAAFVVTAALAFAGPYTGFGLVQYILAFVVIVALQSTLFDSLFLGRMRHARLLREILGEALGRRKEQS